MTAARISRAAGTTLAILGASAVGLGAFGAHALHGALPTPRVEIWRVAVQYHFWHTLAFAVAAMMPSRGRMERAAMWLFAIGVLLFCGSLYALALWPPPCEKCGLGVHFLIFSVKTNARIIGAFTPIGGMCFILGWVALGMGIARIRGE